MEEGCWGQEKRRLVTTVGIPQPYLPLQRRVVSRRGRIIRGGNTTVARNSKFASTDIRHYCNTRADLSNAQQKTDTGSQQTTFEDDKREIDDRKKVNTREDGEENDEEEQRKSRGRTNVEDIEVLQNENEKKTTPPGDSNMKEEGDFCKLMETPSKVSTIRRSKSAQLCLLESGKKRSREEDDDQKAEETPKKKLDDKIVGDEVEKSYELDRRRLMSDLFDEERDGWSWSGEGGLCQGCVMYPCVCSLNKVELRIVEEKERRLRLSSQIPSAPITQSLPTKTTTHPPTTTSSMEEPLAMESKGGEDCLMRKEVKLLKEVKEVSMEVRGPRRTPDHCSTTTPRSRKVKMKVQNPNNKRIVRTTSKEMEEVKKSTKDIRGFFSKGGEEAAGPGLVKRLIKAAETNALTTTTTSKNEVSVKNIKSNLCCSSMMADDDEDTLRDTETEKQQEREMMLRRRTMVRREDDGPIQLARKDVKDEPGPSSMRGMRGNTGNLAGTQDARRHLGGPGVRGAREGGGPGRGGDDETISVCYDSQLTKPNGVTGEDMVSKDVCVGMKSDDLRVVRDKNVVVQRVVELNSRGYYRDRQGDEVCVVLHDGGRPGGGEEEIFESFENSTHKTKPNQVGGGLHRRIQLWEQKTGQKGTIIQGNIGTEANTDGDPRGIFHGRHRKQKTDNN